MHVDVRCAEHGRLDAQRRRPRLHEGIRRRDGLLHHVLEITGHGELAPAGHAHGFDGQQIAAHFRPGQPGYDTDLVFLVGLAETEFPHPGEFTKVFRRDDNGIGLAALDAAHRFSGQIGNLAFQIPDAGLTRIIADQIPQRVLGQRPLPVLERVIAQLFGDQVPLGNLDLLILGIAGNPDDLHPVQERLGQVERVRRGDEHDV